MTATIGGGKYEKEWDKFLKEQGERPYKPFYMIIWGRSLKYFDKLIKKKNV